MHQISDEIGTMKSAIKCDFLSTLWYKYHVLLTTKKKKSAKEEVMCQMSCSSNTDRKSHGEFLALESAGEPCE